MCSVPCAHPIHISGAFLFTPSHACNLYLLLLRFLNRQYIEVFVAWLRLGQFRGWGGCGLKLASATAGKENCMCMCMGMAMYVQ